MLTDLTSPTQSMLKYVWPAGWIGIFGYVLAASILRPESIHWTGSGAAPWWGRPLLAVLVAIGILIAWHTSVPLKRVRAGDGFIEAEGLRRTVRIDAAQVERVHVRGDWSHRRYPVVEIHLRTRGPFGKRIDFVPSTREAVERVQRELDTHA